MFLIAQKGEISTRLLKVLKQIWNYFISWILLNNILCVFETEKSACISCINYLWCTVWFSHTAKHTVSFIGCTNMDFYPYRIWKIQGWKKSAYPQVMTSQSSRTCTNFTIYNVIFSYVYCLSCKQDK